MTRTCLCLLLVGLCLVRADNARLQTRSDDSDPLSPIVQRLAAEVTELKARLDAMQHRVAFSAQPSSDHPTAYTTSPFKFDHVIFNDGNAYDPQLGIFTAPFPGVYTFSVQLFTYGPQRPLVDIRLNGNPVHRMALDTTLLGSSTNGEDSDSMTVVLKLASGDRVWVQSVFSNVNLWGSIHTFFNGLMLYSS